MNKLQNVFRTHKKGFLMTLVFLMLVLIVGVSCAFGIKGKKNAPKGSEVVAETITPRNSGKWTDEGNYATSFAGGTGTETNPYLISNGAQLAKVASDVNSGTVTFDGIYFKLTSDIDLLDYYWDPIGGVNMDSGAEYYFNGNIDGDNHVINGMVVSTSGAFCLAGLIGYGNSNIIKNLGIENSYIENTNSTVVYAGVIAGISGAVSDGDPGSSIQNCYSKANIVIKNCTNTSTVGGLVGSASGSTFEDCYNAGNISVETVNGSVGGISAYRGTFTNCYNSGSIYVESTRDVTVGGVSADSDYLSLCCNEGEIKVVTSQTCSVGGLSGESTSINNSYNAGNVTVDASSANGEISVGGLLGRFGNDTISKSFNTGSISVTSGSSTTYAGGLAGYYWVTVGGQVYSMTDCFNVGKATTGDTNTVVYGLVGSMSDVSGVSNCYSPSTASGFSSTAIGSSGRTATADEKFGRIDDLTTLMKDRLNFGTENFGTYTNDYGNNLTASWSSAWDFEIIWAIISGYYPIFKKDYERVLEPLKKDFWLYNYTDSFAGGSGTESDPYLISTPQELAKLAFDVNINGMNYAYEYFKLTDDIDLSGKNWDPIGVFTGSDAIAFGGNFDGDYHIISNMKVNGNYSLGGLFGMIQCTGDSKTNKISLKNIGVTNCDILIQNPLGGFTYTGGIVGYGIGLEMSNCFTSGYLELDCTVMAIGGIMGIGQDIYMSKVYNRADFYVTDTAVNTSSWRSVYCGGLIGDVLEGESNITDCFDLGIFKEASRFSSLSNSYLGGIAGYTESATALTISNSYYDYNFKGSRCTIGSGEAVMSSVGYIPDDSYDRNDFDILMTKKENFGTNSFSKYYMDDGTIGGDAVWSTPWDFENIWDIDSFGFNYMLPTFQRYLKVILWLNNSATDFAGGTGTQDDPYLISTPEQLAKIAHDVNVKRISFPDKYFKLTSDIDLSGKYWTPIGCSEALMEIGFSIRSFDGGNHVIRGLNIDGKYGYTGLFGFIYDENRFVEGTSNIEIKNLGLEEGKIRSPYGCAASLVAICYGNSVVINNCYNTCYVEGAYGGGLVGVGVNTTFNGCYNTGDVKMVNTSSGYTHAGGIIGNSNIFLEMNECYNTGSIYNKDGSWAGTGGLVGCFDGDLIMNNSFNLGDIVGADEGTGGLIGQTSYEDTSLNMVNCFAECDIKAVGRGTGGLIGKASSNNKSILNINFCYYKGKIETTTSNVNSSYAVGGLIGYLNCTEGSGINDCYAIATINASSLTSLNYVKEFIGYNSTSSNITISDYYAGAEITYSGGTSTSKVYDGTFASDKWFYHEKLDRGELTLKSIYLIGKVVDTTAEQNLARLTDNGFVQSAA